MSNKLFPCSIVGSYSQPDWLVCKERVILAPDCGLKYIPREQAFKKL